MSEQNGQVTALTAPAQNGSAVDAIRLAGQTALAERKALNDMYRMIEGVEWGSGNSVVRGSGFSEAARAALAKFCVVTRANPQIHVDLLGGKPYLNAQYCRDKCSADPYFIEDFQRNISPTIIQQLRDQAQQAIDEAKRMGLPEPTQEVQDLLAEARTLARLHAEYAVPAWATVAYETTIRRYTENAPLEKIRNGEVDPAPFIRTVRECNWAGNKPKKESRNGPYDSDPIGNADPEKSARTRSFRRCARNAFSAWFDQFDEDISRANNIVEAEWTEIRDDRSAAQALAQGEQQAVTSGAGEPGAASTAGAQQLPVEDVEDLNAAADAAFTDEEKHEARRAYFGSLKAAELGAEADRKRFQTENGLGESSQGWGRAEFDRAQQLLEPLIRQRLLGVIGGLGHESIDDYARSKNQESPRGNQDLKVLLGYALADAGE